MLASILYLTQNDTIHQSGYFPSGWSIYHEHRVIGTIMPYTLCSGLFQARYGTLNTMPNDSSCTHVAFCQETAVVIGAPAVSFNGCSIVTNMYYILDTFSVRRRIDIEMMLSAADL